MNQTSTPTTVNRPRLVRFINDLGMGAPQLSHEHFTRRLGQLFDLPGSIAVAAAQAKPSPISPAPGAAEPGEAEPGEIGEVFLRRRGEIIQTALRAFVPDSGVRIRFPTPAGDAEPLQALAPERYIAFYAAQQREADFRVRKLHAEIRAAAAACAPELARLCALDEALGKQLAGPARKFFNAVPLLLQQRLEHLLAPYLCDESARKPEDANWQIVLGQYRSEMQGMLLAEIETRLLPTTGLVEAVNAEILKGNHD